MMAAMDISSRAEFAASVEQVFAMMTDKAFLEEVCRASHARSYEVSVTGTTTRTLARLPSPESAARFTGPELTVVEEVAWGPADAGGSRSGRVDLTIPGSRSRMRGTMGSPPAVPAPSPT